MDTIDVGRGCIVWFLTPLERMEILASIKTFMILQARHEIRGIRT